MQDTISQAGRVTSTAGRERLYIIPNGPTAVLGLIDQTSSFKLA